MIAVAESNTEVKTRTINSRNVALSVVWPKTETVNDSLDLIVRSPLDAIFAEGISWEDAEWH